MDESDVLIEWVFGTLLVLSAICLPPDVAIEAAIGARGLNITVNDIGVSAIDDHLTYGIIIHDKK